MKIRNTALPPPGMPFFAEVDGERVEHYNWFRFIRFLSDVMKRHGVEGDPAEVAANCMCPHAPSWYCTGVPASPDVVTRTAAMENARRYFGKRVVPFSVTSERLRTCMACPKHSRELGCITCSGLFNWMAMGFSGRRVAVPEDRGSGTCNCAKTLESVIATVDYGPEDPVWDGVPDGCWRKEPHK